MESNIEEGSFLNQGQSKNEMKQSQNHDQNKPGLNYFFAALALLSTMIGGGIAGLPYSYYQTGLSLGLLINISMVFITSLSCYLYMLSKDLLGGALSISEIGFKLMGRSSIFFNSVVQVLLAVGLLIIYFILFGKICNTLYLDLTDTKSSTKFIASTKFYVLILGAVNFIPIYKRTIKELKILSIFLFTAISVLVVGLIIYVFMRGTSLNPEAQTQTLGSYWSFKLNRESATAISVIVNAFMFQLTLFSTYTSLKIQSTEYCQKAVHWTLGLSITAYLSVSFIVVYLFGSQVQQSFFQNMGNDPCWQTYLLRFSYLGLIVCHIPYIFFAAKESTLVIIDEACRRRISRTLGKQIVDSYLISAQKQALSKSQASRVSIFNQNINFKEMSPWIYYPVTTILYIACVMGGVFINDLGIVFEFLAAFTLSFIIFIWPGMFFILSVRKQCNSEEKKQKILLIIGAWILCILGILLIVLIIGVNVYDVIKLNLS